jgi:hypothetical protein
VEGSQRQLVDGLMTGVKSWMPVGASLAQKRTG